MSLRRFYMPKKYMALELIWIESQQKYVNPGEVAEFSPKAAKILLEKKVIKPYRAKVGKIEEEKDNGTDN
jgi:hypothetical protein